jgi:hypothetical protein
MERGLRCEVVERRPRNRLEFKKSQKLLFASMGRLRFCFFFTPFVFFLLHGSSCLGARRGVFGKDD